MIEEISQFANLGGVVALGAWFIYWYFKQNGRSKNGTTNEQLKQKTTDNNNQHKIDLAVLAERMRNIESNHLIHQEAIVNYMKEDRLWKKEHEAEHNEFKMMLQEIANKISG